MQDLYAYIDARFIYIYGWFDDILLSYVFIHLFSLRYNVEVVVSYNYSFFQQTHKVEFVVYLHVYYIYIFISLFVTLDRRLYYEECCEERERAVTST